MVHEKPHPSRLGNAEKNHECNLGHYIGRWTKPAKPLQLEDPPLPCDFAASVVRAHNAEQDDLEHRDSGDEGPGLRSGFQEFGRFLVPNRKLRLKTKPKGPHFGKSVPSEHRDDRREAEDQKKM